jgi:outer membrane murein-binding lipoprotein Lpp
MNKTVLMLIAVLGVSLVAGCASKKPRPTPTSSNAAASTDES